MAGTDGPDAFARRGPRHHQTVRVEAAARGGDGQLFRSEAGPFCFLPHLSKTDPWETPFSFPSYFTASPKKGGRRIRREKGECAGRGQGEGSDLLLEALSSVSSPSLPFGFEAEVPPMAEICCGVVGGSEASASACETTSRTARRRRMDIKRFRFVAGVPTVSEDPGRKRQRIDCSVPCSGPAAVAVAAVAPLGVESDVVGDRLDGGGPVVVRKDLRSSSDPSAVLSSSPLPACASMASDDFPRYGVTSVCGRRRDMEDAVCIRPTFSRGDDREEPGFHFFGVYDGHGCSHVAVSCKDRMHEVVTEEMERRGGCSGPQFAEPEWTAVMQKSFARMDAEVVGWSNGAQQNASCRCEMQTPKCDHVGSTAVVAVVTPDRIVVANCGDSRAVLCRKGVPVPLSSDHKPDRPDELQRIQEAGGRVIYWDGARVLGVLAMSRAIGDNYLKPFVISEPEVTVTERDKDDECLILASDGLWDVVPNETACDIVRMCLRGSGPPSAKDRGASPPRHQPEAESRDGGCVGGSDKACADAALLLTKLALARQSADNVSVVVVDLRRSSS